MAGHFNTVGTDGGWRLLSSRYGYDEHYNKEEKQEDGPTEEAAEEEHVGYGIGGGAVAASMRIKRRGG